MFNGASVFNQDVSKWNTGAVKSMTSSKCIYSLVSVARLSCYCGIFNAAIRVFHLITFLTRSVISEWYFLLLYWVTLSFVVASSLAVFLGASAFNADVSEWNTGAVTTMQSSKCTLSPPLHGYTPSVVVYFNMTTSP